MIYFEDIEVGRETEFGRYEVTREEVLDFARKYDPQPFHLSDEEAAKTHFGRLAASGWHTCAMTMAVIARAVVRDEQAGLGSPGVSAPSSTIGSLPPASNERSPPAGVVQSSPVGDRIARTSPP